MPILELIYRPRNTWKKGSPLGEVPWHTTENLWCKSFCQPFSKGHMDFYQVNWTLRKNKIIWLFKIDMAVKWHWFWNILDPKCIIFITLQNGALLRSGDQWSLGWICLSGFNESLKLSCGYFPSFRMPNWKDIVCSWEIPTLVPWSVERRVIMVAKTKWKPLKIVNQK